MTNPATNDTTTAPEPTPLTYRERALLDGHMAEISERLADMARILRAPARKGDDPPLLRSRPDDAA
jgi:hypothetical protein